MPRMAAVQRQEKTDEAIELSAKGMGDSAIGREIGLDPRTVKKLIYDELAFRAEHRSQDKERAIVTYKALIVEGWERLAKLDDRSLNVSGILNSIRQAQERIDKITGAEAPIKSQRIDEEIIVEWEDLDRLAVEGEEG